MKQLITMALLLLWGLSIHAQSKQPLTHDVYNSWHRIGEEHLSPNGKWAAHTLQPQEGDATLIIQQPEKGAKASFARGHQARFSYDNAFLIFTIRPHLDTLKAMRRRKADKDLMPQDSLSIYELATGKLTKFPEVNSYKMPKKQGGWLAYQLAEWSPSPDTLIVEGDTTITKPSWKKESKESGTRLVLQELATGKTDTFLYVLDYLFDEQAQHLFFTSSGDDSLFLPGAYRYNLTEKQLSPLLRGEGTYKHLSADKKGQQAVFVAGLDTTEAQIRYFGLYHWKVGMDSARLLMDSSHPKMPADWLVSEHESPFFSDDGSKLFFGISPEPILQDTSLLEEEIVNVEVWNWKDTYLHTQQNIQAAAEKKRAYLTVAHLNDDKIVQLGTQAIPDISLTPEKNASVALGTSNLPYGQSITWEGFPPYHDVFAIDLQTGEKKQIATKVKGYPNLSPAGKFAYWYESSDTAWQAYDLGKNALVSFSDEIPTQIWSELHDYPADPSSYGYAGWTENDEHFLIYDRYDIWAIDMTFQDAPKNITQNGRATKTVYRYQNLDSEQNAIGAKEEILLHAFREASRQEGYFSLKMGKDAAPKQLILEDYRFNRPLKAKEAEAVLFTKQSYQKFPDLQFSADGQFGNTKQISEANPQQSQYLWGSAEVVSWTSLDGIPLQGLLYKPENFDPNKQYPMLVNFYERNSHNLHRHRIPEPHRSTINYPYYVSNDYVIFVPDVPYKPGYPGESCFNAVMPGIQSQIEKGFVDAENIGVQGHSWGGYQVAYLVTRTNQFKAAESGAPVVNMFSAYGGIRWWTGLSRMFQYEHSQSRIGGTPWEYPLRYIENSPLFTMDKVQTPLLIMHNDADGHVPWYQGIEMFVALRRLGKPAWMLNYNNEPHWPLKWQNQKDFAMRMSQFFDHYLKGAPMPVWMDKGIPATEKGINLGYEPAQAGE